MKFSQSLQFNAVPDWISYYIDYASLKKLLYQLEHEQVSGRGSTDHRRSRDLAHDIDAESLGLLGTESVLNNGELTDPERTFVTALNGELSRIKQFYAGTESKLYKDQSTLLQDSSDYFGSIQDQRNQEESYSGASNSGEVYHPQMPRRPSNISMDDSGDEDEDEEDEHGESVDGHSGVIPRNKILKHFTSLADYAITLRKRAIMSYVSLTELASFVELNKTGFRKALKKFDKTLDSNMRQKYMDEVLAAAYPFSDSTVQTLQKHIDEAVALYSDLATNGNVEDAEEQLKLHLREHVVWERNTVWRDMIGLERQTQAAGVTSSEPKKPRPKYVQIGRFSVPSVLLSDTCFKLVFIGIIFLLILAVPVLKSPAQNNCLALVVGASLLWATEAMPLFVTSLLVPFLVTLLRIPIDESTGERMSAEQASKFVFSQMWSSVIMVLLGGFTLAAALSKYQIAKIMATAILSRSGTNPNIILLTLMFVATFLSMWISNVAAPVLCYSLADPLLRNIPEGDSFAQAIILGIALASNIGGMVSPIASPQNIIALENMNPEPSWGQWFAVAIPVSLVGLVLVWLLLVFTFKKRTLSSSVLSHIHISSHNDKLTFTQWYVVVVTIGTIILWCLSHQLEGRIGEMGVLAIVPIVLFFGTGMLSSADFNNFLWTIIALAMGGIALGKAVSSSGLLATVAHGIQEHTEGMSLYFVMLIFGAVVLVVATFVSHTVAALIILPLVQSVGQASGHSRLLVMGCALLCSAAMGLPTSGFPNVTAVCMVDQLGKPYLTVSSFISRGVISSIFLYGVIASLGYLLMLAMGF